MRVLPVRTLRVALIALALVACDAARVLSPLSTAPAMSPESLSRALTPIGPQDVRVSEFHYDNTGTDVGEAIEISGPAGTDLTGWSIVRYNGTNLPSAATVYTSVPNPTLTGVVIPATASCGTRGVVTLAYPQDGLQNGSSDGFALVDAAGAVVEFLSYEGTITGGAGPALGLVSTNVGVSETGSQLGTSIKRVYDASTGTFSWIRDTPTGFGTCSDDNSGTIVVPPTIATVTVTPAETTVVVGATVRFLAVAKDADGVVINGAAVSWLVAETGLATVDGTGLVTTTAAGDVNVTATAGGQTGAALLHVTPPVVVPPGVIPDIRFSELHYDNVGTDANEALEIEGPAGTSLAGWSIVLYSGNPNPSSSAAFSAYNTTTLTGSLGTSCNTRGVLVTSYPVNGIQNAGSATTPFGAGFALVNAAGAVVEFLSYEGSFTASDGPAAGLTSRNIGVEEGSSTAANQSLQRAADGASWTAPASSAVTNTMGFVNACGAPPAPTTSISFSGRDPSSDPPLPVGFEAQIFATERNNGVVVPTTFTWTSDTPTIASIDADGVLRALSSGTAVLRATATDGTTATYALPTVAGVLSATSQYQGNTEFGEPTDSDASDDFIVRRETYTASYSRTRNTPNWVSFRLDATNYGAEDRCNCFTPDPQLPASFARLSTADYTGAGAFAGYGIDRGHMTRSADRTAANLDNATSYYFSNIVPQAADQNQGPWAIFENYLGDFARNGGKQVYVVTGVAGNKGTVKGLGKIVIPAYTWKVALIMPDGQGLNDVRSTADVEIVSVVMPNEPGVRNVDWNTYRVTVDSVEALSGYDVLALLPDNIERAVETNDRPPVAAISGPSTGAEGAPLAFDASGSTDPDAGDVLTYSWNFGDGATATGATTSHAFADNGAFTVTVTVADAFGLESSKSLQVIVNNVVPSGTITAPATVAEGSSIALALTGASDASTVDAAALTIELDCGDGAGFVRSEATSCATNDNGARTVRARVSDKDGGVSTYESTVQITNVAPTASLSAPATLVEGSAFTLSLASIADVSTVDAATIVAELDCGDGLGWRRAVAGSVICATSDNATRAVLGRVTDKDGGVSEYTASVAVTNAAPVIASFVAPTAPASVGAPVTATVQFTDVGTGDTHTATIAWGDGQTSVVNAGSSLSASASHSYARAGLYQIGVTVADDDGGSAAAQASALFVVFDAALGDARANGWIPVASGASEKAMLKFDASYASGNVLGGEFRLRSQSLNLDSRSLTWLVVNGADATARGTGSIEGGAPVEFTVTVRDGKVAGDKVDRVRVRITSLATGAVLYDSEPGVDPLASPIVPLGGGNVSVGKGTNGGDDVATGQGARR